MYKLLLIVPAYNEEKYIGNVLTRTQQLKKPHFKLDVLVIDDGSKDNTTLVAENNGVNVVRHSKNIGEEGAIQTGFDYALRHNFDYVVKLDADGQHNPEDVPKILKPLLEDRADVVIGARYGEYEEPLLFKFGRTFCSLVISFLIRSLITDVTSGFKGRSRRCVQYSRALYVMANRLHSDTVNDIEEILRYSKRGFRILEVPVKMEKSDGESKCYFSLRLLKFPFSFLTTILKYLITKV